jgi:putative transposase
LDDQAKKADWNELLKRYGSVYGPVAILPSGSIDFDVEEIPDSDCGKERLRVRLGSVFCFMQELQQTFSRWYNKRNNRVGYFWSSRFKSILVSRGESQLVCSSYIDLNPIRAGIVRKPEEYRWCTLGYLARNSKKDQSWINPIPLLKEKGEGSWDRYRLFVYYAGPVERPGTAAISVQVIDEITQLQGRLYLSTKLRYRVTNLSEGLAIGTQSFVESIQTKLKREFIRARECLQGIPFYTTRILAHSS